MKRIIYCILLALGFGAVHSQTVPLQVINSAGGGGPVGNGVEVYYNVGETVITTVGNSNHVITQGFLQPNVIGKLGLSATPFVNNVSCNSKKDGMIIITPTISGVSSMSNYTFHYYWNPPSLCPTNDCASVDSLAPGTYSVMVVSVYNGSLTIPNDTVMIDSLVINDNTSPCLVHVYNGVTPNGDGHNDIFFVKNIDQYQDNIVYIYNRWGQKLDEIKNYDNIQNFWPDPTKAGHSIPPSGTYFYVIQLDKGTKPLKGWIELTRQ